MRPGQSLYLGIAHPGVQCQRQREVDVRGAGLPGFLQHPLFLRLAVRLADGVANLQLEHLSFAQPHSKDVARLSQDAQQKSDFFVDRLRSGPFIEPIILILDDSRFIKVHQHLASQQPLQMVDCIIGKHCRVGEAQLIAIEELVCHIAEGADSLMARVGEVIEALFQLATTLLFRISCNGFGGALARLLDAPSREPELIPPDIAATKETHTCPFIARISAAVGSAGQSDSSLERLTSSCLVHETGTCGNSLLGTLDIINPVFVIRTSAMVNL